MKKYAVVLTGLCTVVFVSIGLASSVLAGPGSGLSSFKVNSNIQTVGYGYCHRWRHRCAREWGWGSWDYRRCLKRHDCYTRHHQRKKKSRVCRPIRERCADRYDYGTRGYRSCLKEYGCSSYRHTY